MKNRPDLHQLLILSQDYDVYDQIIEQAGLPNLTIHAFDDPIQAIKQGNDCDLIVGEPSLVNALNRGSLAGAVLDVFIEEPLSVDHPLWHTPNTYITSHTTAKNYLPDIALVFLENYKLFINGRPLHYQVNFEQQY
jgi:hypothetical protein